MSDANRVKTAIEDYGEARAYGALAVTVGTADDLANVDQFIEQSRRDLIEAVAHWIEGHNGWGDEGARENARAWREEMHQAVPV